ncbi:MAG: DUF2177 family protein [Candidatus Omnitrophota bacterium]|jgi:uncharacterized membrane protein
MKAFFKLYIIALVVFLALDALWLGLIAKDFFLSQLGPVLPLTLSVIPALVFYLLFAAGIVVFAVDPALKMKSLGSALARGAFLGLVTYGAYDLTNHATVANWPVIVTAVDMTWGSSLTAVVSSVTFLLGKKLFLRVGFK